MNDSPYSPIYKQATDLQYRFHDYVGDHNHPAARLLERQIHTLAENAKMRKDPRMLENQVRSIQGALRQIEHQPDHPLSFGHADLMHHDYETMRRSLRTFDNY